MPVQFKLDSNIKKWQRDGERAAGEFNKGVLTRKISIAWSKKMRDFTKINFITRGGGDWPPLSSKYALRKGNRGAGILRLTDKLYRSVTTRGGDNIAQLRRRGFGMEYKFGTKDEKAPFHQYGTSRGIPARPFLTLTESQELDMQEAAARITVKHLARTPFFDKLRGAGFQVRGGPTGVGIPRF